MALNFNLLQAPDIGGQIMAGQQDAQNRLMKQEEMAASRQFRQAQLENQRVQTQGIADERAARAKQHEAEVEKLKKDSEWLENLRAKFAENGQELTPEVATQMVTSGHPVYTQIGSKALESFQSAKQLASIFGTPPTPGPGTQVASAGPGVGFDVDTANRQITQLNALGTPQTQSIANSLIRQVAEHQRNKDREADNNRQAARDAQAAADRAEARALRLTIAGTGRRGSGGGGANLVGEVGKGIVEIVDRETGEKRIVSKAEAVRLGAMSAKEANADAKVEKADEKVAQGQEQVRGIIDELRANYDTLDRARAIPNTQRNALSNISASIGASGVGQLAGRIVGTENQASRDVISSSRIQLLNGIKQATGMSAQQLNSNVELQTWLKAVTDPSQSKQAVDRILNNIENFVAKNAKTQSAAPAATKSGASVSNW